MAYRRRDLAVDREGKGGDSAKKLDTPGMRRDNAAAARGGSSGEPVTRSPRFQLTGFLSRGIACSPTALYKLPVDFSCHRVSYFKRTGNGPVADRERGTERENRSVSLRDDRRGHESGPRARKLCV